MASDDPDLFSVAMLIDELKVGAPLALARASPSRATATRTRAFRRLRASLFSPRATEGLNVRSRDFSRRSRSEIAPLLAAATDPRHLRRPSVAARTTGFALASFLTRSDPPVPPASPPPRPGTAQNENLQLRLNSIRRLTTIATALGPERTRDELVPFLTDNDEDEDECLLAVAEEMGNLIPKVGGPEYARVLLPPLETLATVEETAVREKAVASARAVGEAMRAEDAHEHYVPAVLRLAGGDWFTARVSACGILATAYGKCDATRDDLRRDLRSAFAKLCDDDTPMVRRAAAQHLGAFAAKCDKALVETEIMALFKKLTTDEQDSVRLLAVEDCAALGKLLDRAECVAEVVPAAKKFAADKSWRVRYNVAQQLYSLCESVGAESARAELLPAYEALLTDGEAEVRIAAAGCASDVARLVGPDAASAKIVPKVKDLAQDASQHVRAALASVIMGLAPTLGKDRTIDQLLPVFLILLKDEFPEVRLNIISKLDQVNQVIGVDLLSQELLPAIKDLAEDIHWRVRLAIIEYIPLLASQMGTAFLFQKAPGVDGAEGEQLNALCLRWLSDRVYSIREAAAVNLQKLAEVFGAEWARAHVLPKVMELAKNDHYLYRATVVRALTLLAVPVGQETCMREIMPALKLAAKDKVPNVRFSVAKALGEVASALDRTATDGEVRPALVELESDPDADVRFYAGQALQLCDAKA